MGQAHGRQQWRWWLAAALAVALGVAVLVPSHPERDRGSDAQTHRDATVGGTDPRLGGRAEGAPPDAPRHVVEPEPGEGTVPGEVSLRVHVCDAAGVAIEEATATVVDSRLPVEARPVAPGTWEIATRQDQLPLRVTCTAAWYVDGHLRVETLPSDAPTREFIVCLRGAPGARPLYVRGRVLDAKSRYVEGAQITLRGDGRPSLERVTGPQGKFSFDFDAPVPPWDLLEVEPPPGRSLRPITIPDVSVPRLCGNLVLKLERDALGRIEASAPSPRGIVPWDGRTPIEFILMDEDTGFGHGGGGTAKKRTAIFRRVHPGRYRIVARVGGMTYAEASAQIDPGKTTRVDLVESIPPQVRGRFDETWDPRPAAVRVLPASVHAGARGGAYDQFDASMLTVWTDETAVHLRDRVRRGPVDQARAFDVRARESGPLVLEVLAADGRCLARFPFVAARHGGNVFDLGTLSDPCGRREVHVHMPGSVPRPGRGPAVVSILHRTGTVLRSELGLEDGVLRIPGLLPGDYLLSVFESTKAGQHRGIAPVFRLEVPLGSGALTIHWDPPTPPGGG